MSCNCMTRTSQQECEAFLNARYRRCKTSIKTVAKKTGDIGMTKAVFFDIDDTIYDYIGAHNNTMPVMKEWAYENLGIAKEDLEKYVAEARVKADDRAGRDYAVNHNRLVRFQCMLETLGKPVFPYAYEMYNLYWETLIDQIIPSPGIEELMKELKQRGIYIGIGSNMTSDVQYRKILKLGLGKYIDGIVTSEEAGEEKPHRKLFDLCVEKAGVMVEESIFIGDSIAHDVTGAQNIGMPVILYRPKENVNEIEWLQTEKGKCPVIAHFSQFFEAEKML
ncbi:HAD family hydrolase [Ruminococcus sp. AF25-3LB]|nr:HAD family hydrolase [Ruminococcus sp. AF25-3LB]RGG30938.1 HAD family hydrolase [Ruminococcus sp. AF25-17]